MYVLGKAGEEGGRSSRREKCSGVSSFNVVRWYEYMHRINTNETRMERTTTTGVTNTRKHSSV